MKLEIFNVQPLSIAEMYEQSGGGPAIILGVFFGTYAMALIGAIIVKIATPSTEIEKKDYIVSQEHCVTGPLSTS